MESNKELHIHGYVKEDTKELILSDENTNLSYHSLIEYSSREEIIKRCNAFINLICDQYGIK